MFSWHTLCVALPGGRCTWLAFIFSLVLWLSEAEFLPSRLGSLCIQILPGPWCAGFQLSHSSLGVEADTELLEDERRAPGWVQSLCSPQPGCLVLAAR